MYLKSLEIIGFKSFANKTRLEFEPGVTAIIGPNGCGKSNVSDAVRWVLGEQRARALRGEKMEDVIFNGTDSQKPLGMAEVSITLADCTHALGVEYDEVCITRRVFRSGESGYFINRKACRLKDIQRLFMNTGIGTDSYSVLEQGKIDQILSSRPDDRRIVFEEASGITKYKADKKEALRKLEYTEANLLRLADVVREVKRQIISLQRQAGKAKRYKELMEEVRGLDLYITRKKLSEYAKKFNEITGDLQVLGHRIRNLHEQVEAAESKAKTSRDAMTQLEQTISKAMEQASNIRGELERTNNLIAMNTGHIVELNNLAQRNIQEIEEAHSRLKIQQAELAHILEEIKRAQEEKIAEQSALSQATQAQKMVEETMDTTRAQLNNLRNESLIRDSTASKLQNELNDLDARDRSAMLKRERLATEKAELERSLNSFRTHREKMDATVARLSSTVTEQTQLFSGLAEEHRKHKEQIILQERTINETLQTLAAKQAQLEMLSGGEARQEGFPPGAQMLLNPPVTCPLDRADIIGPLAEQLKTSALYQTALEAVLRPCIDAIVVRDETCARAALEWLRSQAAGSARLLVVTKSEAEITPTSASTIGESLLDCITFSDAIAPLVRRLFWNVRVVATEAEIPNQISANTIVVSKNGTVIAGSGAAEIWMPSAEDKSPLARHQMRAELQEEIIVLNATARETETLLTKLRNEASGTVARIDSARNALEESRRDLALQEGERQVIVRETTAAAERVETVNFELKSLVENESGILEKRTRLANELHDTRSRQADLRNQIITVTKQLTEVEQQRSDALIITSEHRIIFSQKAQALEHLVNRQQPMEARLRELEALINGRTKDVNSYNHRTENLKQSIEKEKAKIEPLEIRFEETTEQLVSERAKREIAIQTLTSAEQQLRGLRDMMERELNKKSTLEVAHAECKMRHDNALERVTETYRITPNDLAEVEAPRWENDEIPERDVIETQIADLNAKIDSMGPVNLVAIEEHAELEERYAFLNQQQNDLLSAKQQLLDMIRTINATTTELFKETFDKVNINFDVMFKKLFGGGTAKLVLTDDEDVLEAGIEIIARPPGKTPQTISLLSGGERTMTAVALLFALFIVKPSPFCVLDELDAALDDANINRFVDTLKDFLKQSQFIIITHNRQTIATATVIYGVTMQTRGISTIVSMKFSDYQEHEDELK